MPKALTPKALRSFAAHPWQWLKEGCAAHEVIDAFAAAWEADKGRVKVLEGAIDMLPCLEKADESGRGVVPVPEWVIADIAKTRAALPRQRPRP